MSKKIPVDIQVLRALTTALMKSTSQRMLRANWEFVTDMFFRNPSEQVKKKFYVAPPEKK